MHKQIIINSTFIVIKDRYSLRFAARFPFRIKKSLKLIHCSTEYNIDDDSILLSINILRIKKKNNLLKTYKFNVLSLSSFVPN